LRKDKEYGEHYENGGGESVNPSIPLNEFLEMIHKECLKHDADKIKLAIGGILSREPDCVIERYSKISRRIITLMRKQVKMDI